MGEGRASKIDLVFVEEDRTPRVALNYFFSIIFRCETRRIVDLDKAAQAFQGVDVPRMVVMCLADAGDSALDLTRQVAALTPQPFVLVLTRGDDPQARVQLFEAGANDVLQFPFMLKELAYRLRARPGDIGRQFRFGPDQSDMLDVSADIVRRANLTEVEAQVVFALIQHGGEIVSRDELSRAIDKTPWSYGNRKFDVHVASIRKKLETAYGGQMNVRTVRSAGYQLSVAVNGADRGQTA